MKCPNCNKKIMLHKNSVLKCICGRVLMLIEINKAKQIVDVTPNKGGQRK